MQENKILLIIGLGNPGEEYSLTRHNVGFMAIDALAGKDADWKKEKKALVSRGFYHENKAIFVKPQTFMNNSGEAVAALVKFYKIPTENIIVIHDDMDIKLGQKKEKIGGSSAGHNGIKSIDSYIDPNYKRIRIGIGHPRDCNCLCDPVDWVLGKFSEQQLQIIHELIKDL